MLKYLYTASIFSIGKKNDELNLFLIWISITYKFFLHSTYCFISIELNVCLMTMIILTESVEYIFLINPTLILSSSIDHAFLDGNGKYKKYGNGIPAFES